MRILDHGEYSDVGEMTREEFLAAKAGARLWTSNDRLFHLIGSIKSGSII